MSGFAREPGASSSHRGAGTVQGAAVEETASPDRAMAPRLRPGGTRVASGLVPPGPPPQGAGEREPGATAVAGGVIAQGAPLRRPGGADLGEPAVDSGIVGRAAGEQRMKRKAPDSAIDQRLADPAPDDALGASASRDDRTLRAPSATIPFELFGTRITVKTTGGGANVSIKQDDLGKLLAREYLGRLVPASQLTELINSYLSIKFRCSTSLGYNYKKPKREGLGGLARDVLNNVAGDVQDAALHDVPGRLEVWNTLDDLLGGASQQSKTKPLRSVALKAAGTLSMTPNTPWVPFSGALKVAYSAVYEEYLDRIEIRLADISIAGRLNYRLDVALPFGGPGSGPGPDDIDPFRFQYPRTGTLANSSPQRALATHDDDAHIAIGGSSKIKQLAFNEAVSAATFLYDRRSGAYGFGGIGQEQVRKLGILVVLMFLNFTSMFSDLSG